MLHVTLTCPGCAQGMQPLALHDNYRDFNSAAAESLKCSGAKWSHDKPRRYRQE